MNRGTPVRLISFNGSTSATDIDLDPAENYWLLVGETGTVIQTIPSRGVERDRVLVKFDRAVNELGLVCHNELVDSLWIQQGDLIAMPNNTDQFTHITVEALSLPAPQRSELAARLLRSLHNDEYGDDAENLKIVEERIRRYESGEVTGRPVKEVIKEIREKYGL